MIVDRFWKTFLVEFSFYVDKLIFNMMLAYYFSIIVRLIFVLKLLKLGR